MLVRFTKARHQDRPHTFTCVRDDGSTTGMASGGFFVLHDLTHFAVETKLEYNEAFYGLVASGWDIDSFADREAGSRKARPLPLQAKHAEFLVGCLDLERAAGPLSCAEVVSHLATQCATEGLASLDLTCDQLDAIRSFRDELFGRWGNLGAGETLELDFSVGWLL